MPKQNVPARKWSGGGTEHSHALDLEKDVFASDDPEAMDTVAALVRDAGFDPVIVGALGRGKEFEPDTAPYNTGMSGQQLRSIFVR